MAKAEPVLLGLSWADTGGQGHLLQTPVPISRLAPHMENLVRSIVGIGLGRSEKLHLVRILRESAVLYSADVVVPLGEFGVDCNLLQARGSIPSGFAGHIHQTVASEHLAVEAAIVIVLRLGRVVVRAAQIHQIATPIGLDTNTGIERLPYGGLWLSCPGKTLQRNLEARLATGLQEPIIPVHLSEEGIELVPVQSVAQVELIQTEPCLASGIRIESEDAELLPEIILHIATVHEQNIVILGGMAHLCAGHEILPELNRKHLFEDEHPEELGGRLLPIQTNETHRGLCAMATGLPGLQQHLNGLCYVARSLITLSQIYAGNIDLLIPSSDLYPAPENGNGLLPVAETEIGLAEIEVGAGVIGIPRQVLHEKTNIALVFVGFAAAVAVVDKNRLGKHRCVLCRRACPGLVGAALADPGLRAAEDTHIAIDEGASGLLERHTGLLWTEVCQPKTINRVRQHHVAVQKECPGGRGVPAYGCDPLLAAVKGLCSGGPEVGERIVKYATRHVIGQHPGLRLRDGVIRRAGIAEHNRVHFALYGAHEALNNAGLVFDHAEKNNLLLRLSYGRGGHIILYRITFKESLRGLD